MRVVAPFKFYRLGWLLSILLIVLMAFYPANAQIYTYVDERGVIHFTNVPVKKPNKVTPKAIAALKKELQRNRPRFFLSSYYPGSGGSLLYNSGTYSSYGFSGYLKMNGMGSINTNPSPYEKMLEPYITTLASEHGLDPKLVKAVIKAESAFNPSATSPKGAMGLMQLMPGTAMDMGVQDPYHPVQNLKGGISYLREMLRLFDNNLVLALAAYNAGPNAVKQYGGVPPYEETRQYIQRVLQYYSHYSKTSP